MLSKYFKKPPILRRAIHCRPLQQLRNCRRPLELGREKFPGHVRSFAMGGKSWMGNGGGGWRMGIGLGALGFWEMSRRWHSLIQFWPRLFGQDTFWHKSFAYKMRPMRGACEWASKMNATTIKTTAASSRRPKRRGRKNPFNFRTHSILLIKTFFLPFSWLFSSVCDWRSLGN